MKTQNSELSEEVRDNVINATRQGAVINLSKLSTQKSKNLLKAVDLEIERTSTKYERPLDMS